MLKVALRRALKQSRQWPIAGSMKLCWLLTTFEADAIISAHRHTSLVSDKHVHACRFQSLSPSSGTLLWFHAASDENEWWILLWCLAVQTVSARHLSSCWRLFLSSAPRVRKRFELLRRKTPDFTLDTWLLNRPDLDPSELISLTIICCNL